MYFSLYICKKKKIYRFKFSCESKGAEYNKVLEKLRNQEKGLRVN